jgi:hypothetical protein
MSNRQIAEAARVHCVTVGKIRDSLQVAQGPTESDKGGTVIGKNEQVAKLPPGGDQASEEGHERPGALSGQLSSFISAGAAVSPRRI